MRKIATACVAAALGLATLPATGSAAEPSPICVNTPVTGVFCTYDIGPTVREITSDPVGYVCGTPIFTCGRES